MEVVLMSTGRALPTTHPYNPPPYTPPAPYTRPALQSNTSSLTKHYLTTSYTKKSIWRGIFQ